MNDIFATPMEATGIGMMARLDPYPRQAGIFQLTISFNLQELHLEREKNYWVGRIQLATYFPSAKKPNGTAESIKITLTEQRLRETLANGYTMQRLVIAGNRTGDLRVADSGPCDRCRRFGEARIPWAITGRKIRMASGNPPV